MIQERLLDVAIDHFGRFGFDGAATRVMAREAGTAMSSITYHFGSKQGLYVACADHIGKQIALRLSPEFAAIDDSVDLSREEATEVLLQLMSSFVAMMVDPRSENWARFTVREQQEPTEAFERLWNAAMGRVLEVTNFLLARVSPQLDERERAARAILIIGQVLILRHGRASVCKALGVSELGEAEHALFLAQINATTRAILISGD